MHVNAAFTRLTGFLVAEAVGRSLSILYGPNTSSDSLRQMQTLTSTNQDFAISLLCYTKDGTAFVAALNMMLCEEEAAAAPLMLCSLESTTSALSALSKHDNAMSYCEL